MGLAAEWAWTHVWMPLPWPATLAPEGVALGLAMALGGRFGRRLAGRARLAGDKLPSLRYAGVLGAAVIFALTGYGLLSTGESDVRAVVALGPDGMVVQVDPPDDTLLADGHGLAGRRKCTSTRLRRIAPGVYRSDATDSDHRRVEDDDPPARRQRADRAAGLPAGGPRAIPVEEISPKPRFERAFGNEQKLLQRERKSAASWLWPAAYGLVLALHARLPRGAGLGVHRVASPPPEPIPAALRTLTRAGARDPRAPGAPADHRVTCAR